MKKICHFILFGTFGLTAIMVLLIYILVSVGYEQVVNRRAEKHAAHIADATFNGLYHIMKKGGTRQDVAEFLGANRRLIGEGKSK